MSRNLYLAHHGIKGQKWGVRRYQNKDGSYTDEGRKRRGIGSRLPKITPKSKYSDLSDDDIDKRIARRKKEIELSKLEKQASTSSGRAFVNNIVSGTASSVGSGLRKGMTLLVTGASVAAGRWFIEELTGTKIQIFKK